MIAEGKLETSSRIKQRMGAIFEFAAPRYHVNHDPVSLIRRAFGKRLKAARKARPVEHFRAVSKEELPGLLRALRTYHGAAIHLLRWVALTACRTGEARQMRWSEVDRENSVWRIPGERMKARRPHVIPLSRQAIDLLDRIPRHPKSDIVFRNPRDFSKPASENALLVVLAAVGFGDRMTGHGWRSLFSTLANESGLWRSDLIEAALAHAERDTTRAAYLRSDFLEERRPMMQWWADELDRLETRGAARVRSIRKGLKP
jgi:integrase